MKIVKKIMSYEDILYDLRMVCSADMKYKVISNLNSVGVKNFWRLYNNKKSELHVIFPNGSIWKKPNYNEWRFYFNEEDNEKFKIKMIIYERKMKQRNTIEEDDDFDPYDLDNISLEDL